MKHMNRRLYFFLGGAVSFIGLLQPVISLAADASDEASFTATDEGLHIGLEIPIGTTTEVDGLADYLSIVYPFLIALVPVLATFVIVKAAISWSAAMGNSTIIGKAKTEIVAALSAIVIALGGVFLLANINPSLIQLHQFDIPQLNFADPYDILDAEDMQACRDSFVAADYDKDGNQIVCTGLVALDPELSIANDKVFKLEANAASQWNKMAAEFTKKFGRDRKLQVNMTWRGPDYQDCLDKRDQGDGAAAKCASNHGLGSSIDIQSSALTQKEYNWVGCGRTTSCEDKCPEKKKWCTLPPNDYGFSILNYNPNKDAGRITEQHHLDYEKKPSSICSICPDTSACTTCSPNEKYKEDTTYKPKF